MMTTTTKTEWTLTTISKWSSLRRSRSESSQQNPSQSVLARWKAWRSRASDRAWATGRHRPPQNLFTKLRNQFQWRRRESRRHSLAPARWSPTTSRRRPSPFTAASAHQRRPNFTKAKMTRNPKAPVYSIASDGTEATNKHFVWNERSWFWFYSQKLFYKNLNTRVGFRSSVSAENSINA